MANAWLLFLSLWLQVPLCWCSLMIVTTAFAMQHWRKSHTPAPVHACEPDTSRHANTTLSSHLLFDYVLNVRFIQMVFFASPAEKNNIHPSTNIGIKAITMCRKFTANTTSASSKGTVQWLERKEMLNCSDYELCYTYGKSETSMDEFVSVEVHGNL